MFLSWLSSGTEHYFGAEAAVIANLARKKQSATDVDDAQYMIPRETPLAANCLIKLGREADTEASSKGSLNQILLS
jgi:hypothetical protein